MTSEVPIEGNSSWVMCDSHTGHSELWDGHMPIMFTCTRASICKRLFVQFSVRGLGVIPIVGLPSCA